MRSLLLREVVVVRLSLVILAVIMAMIVIMAVLFACFFVVRVLAVDNVAWNEMMHDLADHLDA